MTSRTCLRSFLIASTVVSAAACADDPAGAGAGRVAGTARYHDAATEHDGSPHEAAAPAPGTATLVLEVRGTGALDGVDPSCAADAASGQFRARYAADAALDDGGAYAAALLAADGRVETLGGCAVPSLTVAAITDVVVRAELDATTARCDAYCAAQARASAEAECGVEPAAAACRGDAEVQAAATCQTTCTPQDTVIVAEASLAAGLVGDLDADALRAAAVGDLTVALTFDHVE
ncbi:MAG: hypothetical protein H6709_08425 [Kofleriaceae bacterium]|nr:hypothetical protein [Kofleriaceae bacterium]MCB9572102.1 hypothetical protein [Kofleriaceae bacterium]